MDRLVVLNPGPTDQNLVTKETANLARQAKEAFESHLGFAGSDYYGRTAVEITWQGGQIIVVRPKVEQVITPDRPAG